jgi:hypothetical protein
MWPMGPKRPWLLNQLTQRNVAILTAEVRTPSPLPPDDLVLENAVDGLSKGDAIAVIEAAD